MRIMLVTELARRDLKVSAKSSLLVRNVVAYTSRRQHD